MLVGLPVEATSVANVANQGIGAEPGRDIPIADDPAGFADALIRILATDQVYEQISSNAEAFMRQFFDWEASIRGIESLYREVAAAPRSTWSAA